MINTNKHLWKAKVSKKKRVWGISVLWWKDLTFMQISNSNSSINCFRRNQASWIGFWKPNSLSISLLKPSMAWKGSSFGEIIAGYYLNWKHHQKSCHSVPYLKVYRAFPRFLWILWVTYNTILVQMAPVFLWYISIVAW